MPRRIDLTASSEMCSQVIDHLQKHPGIASITLQPGASVNPGGDVLTIDASNNASLEIMKLLDGLGALEAGTVTISEPTTVIQFKEAQAIEEEGNEAIWQEIGSLMRQDTNPSVNFLLLMGLSGAIAGFGLVSDTLHVVVGAMLIAPGFEPLLRIVFGILGHHHSTTAGLRSAGAGYIVLAGAAALAMAVALPMSGISADEMSRLYWVTYWSKVEGSGVAVSLLAGVAGGIIISTRNTVLATGVMVALALVPSMALVGMGLASGNLDLAFGGLTRWGVEVMCVFVGGGGTLVAKRLLLHRKRAKN